MLAVATVMMMVAAGLVMVLPSLASPHAEAPSTEPVKTMAGPRTVSYQIDHIGESYMKNPDITNFQGNRTLTEGLNLWWAARLSGYGEYIVHNSYPFVTAYTLESGFTTADIDPGFGLTTMARMHIVATNLPTMGTAAGMDPIFIPILNPNAPGGGTVTLQWRSDVATPDEVAQIKAVTSTYFGRVYYGGARLAINDDGYWNLLYGHMTFDAAAAQRFLGLPGTGDLRTEFNAANTGNAIGAAWSNDWLTETGAGGIYDIASAYEYSNDIRDVTLKIDPASTATLLNIRLWSVSWGNDMMLMRYFDVSGLNKNMLSYFEDMYFNATIVSDSANIETSYYMQYAMLGWANQQTGAAAWMLESMHIDYVGSTDPLPAWQSRFNPYDPEKTAWTRLSLLPGTTKYGQQVSYYTAPTLWNLVTGETLSFKLPTRQLVGYTPYVGASDTLSATKVTELNTHAVSGSAVLSSTCIPAMTASSGVVSFTGPTAFAKNPNPGNSLINYTGVPMFVMEVSALTTFNLNLQAGWNLVSVPLVHSYKASTLPGLATGDTVTAWVESTQSYKTFIRGVSPPIADFSIAAHAGIWVWVQNAKTLPLQGTLASGSQSRVITLPASGTGWFILGLESMVTTRHAADIPAMYSVAGKITVVASFDAVAKTYRTWLSAVPAINNFLLVPGQGYWCYATSPGTLSYTA